MKSKTRLYITIVITIILVIAFFVTTTKLIQENGKCVDDPFRYSAIKLKESGGNYMCSCRSLSKNLADFTFSEEGIEILDSNDYTKTYVQEQKIEYKEVNFSNIIN